MNIEYDLADDDKLRNFIPTKAALNLLEEILLSVRPNFSERARILIGAYGRSKSHIVLTILALLMKKDLKLFEKLLPKLKADVTLWSLVENFYAGSDKILPVIINGTATNSKLCAKSVRRPTFSETNRTLFTFLSAEGISTLPTFLSKYRDDFTLITPDKIFDYFAPIFGRELYGDETHKILRKADISPLAAKIVKTLALIYMLEQFELLSPTAKRATGKTTFCWQLLNQFANCSSGTRQPN